MKFLLLWLVALPSMVMAEQPATHGMVLLGKETIFLSHLPMFHPPHDFQVIFSVELDSGSKAKLQASGGDFFTLVPEPFALSEMITHPHSFEAEIYQGHFERGGKLIAEHVKVTRVKVVHAHKLLASAPAGPESKFIVFGSEQEQWMAHFVEGKPSFDQLLSVEGTKEAGTFSFPEIAPGVPAKMGNQMNSTQGFSWAVKKSVYLEFDDLR